MRKFIFGTLTIAALALCQSRAQTKPGSAAHAFNTVQPRQVGQRVRSTPLPYKAIPSGLREAAKPGLMAQQVYKAYGNNRVSITTPKSIMRVDVHATRHSGFAHHQAGKQVRVPQVQYLPRVINGRQEGRPSAVTRATIPELRIARRLVQSQARQETVRAAQTRAAARPAMPRGRR